MSTKNLLKRGNQYCCRVNVPTPLRDLRRSLGIKKASDVVKSLRTSDFRAAQRLLPAAKASILDEFDAETRRLLQQRGPLRSMDEHDVQAASFAFAKAENHLDEVERLRRPKSADIDVARLRLQARVGELKAAVEKGASIEQTRLALVSSDEFLRHARLVDWASMRAEKREALVEALRQDLTNCEYVHAEFEVDRVIEVNRLDAPRDSDAHRTLGRALTKSWLRSLEVQAARDRGDVVEEDRLTADLERGRPDDRSTQPAANNVVDLGRVRGRKVRADDEMREHFENYLREKKRSQSPSALKDLRATFRHFIECAGGKKANEYTKQDAVRFKQGLAHFPANATKRFPGMTFNQVVEAAKREKLAPISTNTARGKLSMIAVFGRWLEDNADGVDGGAFETTAPPRTDRQAMHPFSDEEVVSILNSYAFVGAASSRDYGKPGNFRLRDWHYWLVLISAFTGARANEIAQLETTDIVRRDDVLCFNLTTENGKSLKTVASRRLIPVHPRLIDLGLERYLAESVAAGSVHLLRGIPPAADGRRSTAATRWFGRFLEKVGVKIPGEVGDRGGTHRWRHTLADKIRAAGNFEYQVSLILGHDLNHAAATSDYGQETTMTPRQRFAVISQVEFPGVDYEKLK